MCHKETVVELHDHIKLLNKNSAERASCGGESKETGWNHSGEGPQRKVTIEGFRLGKHEVTFAQYNEFVQATARRPPDDQGWGAIEDRLSM